MTSVCSILIAAQQLSLLVLIGDLPDEPHVPSARQMERQLSQLLVRLTVRSLEGSTPEARAPGQDYTWQMSWRLVFTWQCPIMFIGYSTLFYFIGLSIVVCSPLIQGAEWGPGVWVSIFRLSKMKSNRC